MKSTVKIDTNIIQEETDKEKRTYFYLPKGVKFFGRFLGLFCKFPGVAYYTRIVYWDDDKNALVIVIPCEQDPDMFKEAFNYRKNDLYNSLQHAKKGDTFVFNGEYFVPVDE